MKNQVKAIRVNGSGHVLIYKPEHPTCYQTENWKGYVYEHRYVAEINLGRELSTDEEVHHLDGDPANNNWANLIVISKQAHGKIHQWLDKGAPYYGSVGMNGVNSEKAKSVVLRCKVCNLCLKEKKKFYCSKKCQSAFLASVSKFPGIESLLEDVQRMPMVRVGAKYGVSDNTIRKWLKRHVVTDTSTLSQASSTLLEGATTT